MNYLVLKHQRKGIPSIFALLVVIVFGVGMSLIIKHKPALPEHNIASSVNLERTVSGNIRDNTATIYWRTTEPSTGYVVFGSQKDKLSQKSFDITDTEANLNKKKNHIVTLGDLATNTTYYYYIVIDGKRAGQSEAEPFYVRTSDNINSLFTHKPLFGRIFNPDRHFVSNAVLIANISGAEPLITAIKGDGSYSLPPCCLKNDSTTEVLVPKGDEKVILEVVDEDSVQRQEYTYNFLAENNELVLGSSQTDVLSEQNVRQNFLQPAHLVESIEDIDIIFPRKNAVIPDTKPLFKGVGEPGRQVKGKVEPDGKLFSIAIAETGQWTHTFGTPLSPGSHSVLIETTDKEGKLVSLSRNFTILQSGQAVLGESTPSATLTPVLSPTIVATATLAPTQPFLSPTLGPTIDISGMPTKPPPVSGTNILPFVSVSVGLIIIGMGVLLLY